MPTDKVITYIQPLADWIEDMENCILSQGRFLSDEEMTIAKKLGIKNYDIIRVLESDIVPMPMHNSIKNIGLSMGFFQQTTAGMSFRYGIYLNSRQKCNRVVLIHELAHTLQYEQHGSILAFTKAYLDDILKHGYHQSAHEQEANRLTLLLNS
jgi:hypothetical protein